jgi:hypothetical protein
MSKLWAITSYFNPAKYERRRAAYRVFRQALEVPLLTVEHSTKNNLELSTADAEILLQVTGGDIMWQKERLLNLALDKLPSDCNAVAWLDCDVIFADHSWTDKLESKLDSSPLVQLFSQVNYLGPDWSQGAPLSGSVIKQRPSIASGVCDNQPAAIALEHPSRDQRPGTYANGMAWAAQRDFIDTYRFFDACIMGGGDRAITCAAYGCFQHIFDWHEMNEAQMAYYLKWAEPVYEACNGRVASLEGDIYHQWHGKPSDRGLSSRHHGLKAFDFDPNTDIAIDNGGCWRWNSDKPAMHRYFEDYFSSRREDG